MRIVILHEWIKFQNHYCQHGVNRETHQCGEEAENAHVAQIAEELLFVHIETGVENDWRQEPIKE